MKNITKIMVLALMLTVAVPSVTFAHDNEGNKGDDDRGGRFEMFANKGVKSELLKDFREEKKENRKDFKKYNRFNLVAGENFWMGTVTAKGANTITVRLPKGVVFTVNTSAAVFIAHKDGTSTFSDIQINDKVFVAGSLSGTTVTATKIFNASFPNHKAKVKGTVSVTNSTDNSLTVVTQAGRTVTVNTDSNTVVTQDGTVVPLSTITANSSVIIRGTWSATALDTMIASQIKIK